MGASIMLIRMLYSYKSHELITSEILHAVELSAVGCGPREQQKAKAQLMRDCCASFPNWSPEVHTSTRLLQYLLQASR